MTGKSNVKKRKTYTEKDKENNLKMCEKNTGRFPAAIKFSGKPSVNTKLGQKPVFLPELEQV